MRLTLLILCPEMANFDAVNFSECRSFWRSDVSFDVQCIIAVILKSHVHQKRCLEEW